MSINAGLIQEVKFFMESGAIVFARNSRVDEFGRVFFYKGEVFRGVYKAQVDYCQDLISSDFFKELRRLELVPATEITKYELPGFALILKHDRIQESRPYHWSFDMFKDASLLILKLVDLCEVFGYELKDAHPYNVFFKHNNPVFIDIGSFVKRRAGKNWRAYEEFITSFYIQLLAWSSGDFFFSRKLIEDGNHSKNRTIPMSRILDSSFINTVAKVVFVYRLKYRKTTIVSLKRRSAVVALLVRLLGKLGRTFKFDGLTQISYQKELIDRRQVKDEIDRLEHPVVSTLWSFYHNAYKTENTIINNRRFERIIELLIRYTGDASSLLDLAGNQGVFCELCASRMTLSNVLVSDYDETAVNSAYRAFKASKSHVSPYLLNFMYLVKEEDVEIFRSDIVVALAITHHLILSQNFELATILGRIEKFTTKYVAIEFMPLGVWTPGQNVSVPSWYTLEYFRSEFARVFLVLHEEVLESNRIIFIGQKNKK